jgi:hypothetical protein
MEELLKKNRKVSGIKRASTLVLIFLTILAPSQKQKNEILDQVSSFGCVFQCIPGGSLDGAFRVIILIAKL